MSIKGQGLSLISAPDDKSIEISYMQVFINSSFVVGRDIQGQRSSGWL